MREEGREQEGDAFSFCQLSICSPSTSLSLSVGGNHEASNHLWELAHGGWVAPNIYYLGVAGVVNFGGLRIGGLSGIFDGRDFRSPRVGGPPYSPGALRSAYHLREADIHRLTRLTGPMDVFLSHDWPAGIVAHGDGAGLVRRKRFLASDIDSGALGSPPGAHLLRHLAPRFWFSAHLHTKFAAVVPHGEGGVGGGMTRFLALDKCLPGREFLQVVDVPVRGGGWGGGVAAPPAPTPPSAPPPSLAYDPQWCAIMRATHGLMVPGVHLPRLAPAGPPSEAEVADAAAALEAAHGGSLAIPHNFVVTAPAAGSPGAPTQPPRTPIRSPQTESLLAALGLGFNLDYPHHHPPGGGPPRASDPPPPPPGPPPPGARLFVPPAVAAANPEEIDI